MYQIATRRVDDTPSLSLREKHSEGAHPASWIYDQLKANYRRFTFSLLPILYFTIKYYYYVRYIGSSNVLEMSESLL